MTIITTSGKITHDACEGLSDNLNVLDDAMVKAYWLPYLP